MLFSLAYSDLDFVSRYKMETDFTVIYEAEAAPGSIGGPFTFGVVQQNDSDKFRIKLIIRDRCFLSQDEFVDVSEIQAISHKEIRKDVAQLLQHWWGESNKIA